ncbi:MAG: hypothetical protein K0R66_1417 [Gammaproteobacteria bacterium]|jgi:hypothetical protein|nr:hypothetical protein [Gammaproteobacteria bacterium]
MATKACKVGSSISASLILGLVTAFLAYKAIDESNESNLNISNALIYALCACATGSVAVTSLVFAATTCMKPKIEVLPIDERNNTPKSPLLPPVTSEDYVLPPETAELLHGVKQEKKARDYRQRTGRRLPYSRVTWCAAGPVPASVAGPETLAQIKHNTEAEVAQHIALETVVEEDQDELDTDEAMDWATTRFANMVLGAPPEEWDRPCDGERPEHSLPVILSITGTEGDNKGMTITTLAQEQPALLLLYNPSAPEFYKYYGSKLEDSGTLNFKGGAVFEYNYISEGRVQDDGRIISRPDCIILRGKLLEGSLQANTQIEPADPDPANPATGKYTLASALARVMQNGRSRSTAISVSVRP